MNVLINISEGMYEHINNIQNGSIGAKQILNAVVNGTPIPDNAINGDVISRDAVLAKKVYMETEEGWSGYTVNADYIEQLPPVTVRQTQMIDKSNFDNRQYKADLDTAYECGKASERQTGEWIYSEKINNWQCSKCHQTVPTKGYVGDARFMNEKFKYCPICGSQMRELQI